MRLRRLPKNHADEEQTRNAEIARSIRFETVSGVNAAVVVHEGEIAGEGVETIETEIMVVEALIAEVLDTQDHHVAETRETGDRSADPHPENRIRMFQGAVVGADEMIEGLLLLDRRLLQLLGQNQSHVHHLVAEIDPLQDPGHQRRGDADLGLVSDAEIHTGEEEVGEEVQIVGLHEDH